MNESAYYVISKAGGTPYAGAVAEKQKYLNDRWRALCQQLGITYKKAEETRYGLKLLEIQLKQLNTWMTELESRLVDFTVARLCVVAEIHKKVKEMKVTLKNSVSQTWWPLGPLQNTVTWYKKKTETAVGPWKLRMLAFWIINLFVFLASQRRLSSSKAFFVSCDRILQRAYYTN